MFSWSYDPLWAEAVLVVGGQAGAGDSSVGCWSLLAVGWTRSQGAVVKSAGNTLDQLGAGEVLTGGVAAVHGLLLLQLTQPHQLLLLVTLAEPLLQVPAVGVDPVQRVLHRRVSEGHHQMIAVAYFSVFLSSATDR